MEKYKRQINDARYCPLLELLVRLEQASLRGLARSGAPFIDTELTQRGFRSEASCRVKDFRPLPHVFSASERVRVRVIYRGRLRDSVSCLHVTDRAN